MGVVCGGRRIKQQRQALEAKPHGRGKVNHQVIHQVHARVRGDLALAFLFGREIFSSLVVESFIHAAFMGELSENPLLMNVCKKLCAWLLFLNFSKH